MNRADIHTENTILAAQERRVLFEQLYKNTFPPVARFIRLHNGSLQDARDIFQDALVIFYEKLQEGRAEISSQEGYLSGIAKHLWFRKIGKDVATLSIGPAAELIAADEIRPAREQKSLMQVLEVAGKKCMELLRAFYYDRQGAEQVKERFGYGSVRSATVQKFKCLEKIREHVKERKIFYEDITG